MTWNANYADTVNSEYVAGQINVGTSEVLASADGISNLAARQELIIYNQSNKRIYMGPSGVDATIGIPIEPEETINLQVGDQLDVYLIGTDASNDVVVHELA